MLIIGAVLAVWGLHDFEPITISGVFLVVIALMYNLIPKAFKK